MEGQTTCHRRDSIEWSNFPKESKASVGICGAGQCVSTNGTKCVTLYSANIEQGKRFLSVNCMVYLFNEARCFMICFVRPFLGQNIWSGCTTWFTLDNPLPVPHLNVVMNLYSIGACVYCKWRKCKPVYNVVTSQGQESCTMYKCEALRLHKVM